MSRNNDMPGRARHNIKIAALKNSTKTAALIVAGMGRGCAVHTFREDRDAATGKLQGGTVQTILIPGNIVKV